MSDGSFSKESEGHHGEAKAVELGVENFSHSET